MGVVNQEQLRDIIAEVKEMKKGEAEAWLKDVFNVFETIIIEYQEGFKFGKIGTFETCEVKAEDKVYNHPQTGEKLSKHIPAHTDLKFKFNKGKQSVRQTLKTDTTI